MRRLPFVMVLSVSALAVGCGDPPPVENPPQPTSAPTAEPAPTATAEPAPTATAAPAPTATATAAVEAPPPPKPVKERISGTWTFSFEGDVKAKKEEELKKKLGAKEKDPAKLDAKVAEEIKKIADEAAGEWVEFKDGYYVSHVTEKGKDKVILKVKYEVVKEEGNALTMKAAGKPDVGKMDPKMEVTVTLADDNTLQMPDPKKGTLIFKRKQ